MPEKERAAWGQDRRSPPRAGPRPVSTSLRQAALSLGAEGAVELAAVRARWVELVGPQVAAHAWPQGYRQGALSIATDHHAWAAELRSLCAELVKRLQDDGLEVASAVVTVSQQRPSNW